MKIEREREGRGWVGEGREEWKEGGEGEREGREIGSGGSEEKGREREGRKGGRERREMRTTRGKKRMIFAPSPPHQYQHQPSAMLSLPVRSPSALLASKV